MQFNKWSEEIHALAVEKGWWENKLRPMTELLMLVISEIAEATEQARANKPPIYLMSPAGEGVCMVTPEMGNFEYLRSTDKEKPEGEAVELADAVIRVFDIAGKHEMNLDREAIESSSDPFFFQGRSPLEVHFIFCQTISLPTDFHKFPALLSHFINEVQAYFTHKGWNLEDTIRIKHEYNKTRPHRHGGKKY